MMIINSSTLVFFFLISAHLREDIEKAYQDRDKRNITLRKILDKYKQENKEQI